MRHHTPAARPDRPDRAAHDVRCAVCARRLPPQQRAPHGTARLAEAHRCALCQVAEGDLVGDLLAHRDAATAR